MHNLNKVTGNGNQARCRIGISRRQVLLNEAGLGRCKFGRSPPGGGAKIRMQHGGNAMFYAYLSSAILWRDAELASAL